MSRKLLLISLMSLLLSACASKQAPYDYTNLQASKPKSILVLPVVNNSVEVNGGNIFLSTITKPIAEKGYYVFPVAVVDNILKESGIQTASDAHNIPLDKLYDVFGADAVLYATVNDWGARYQIISSVSVVDVDLKLIDGQTGRLLWEGHANMQRDNNADTGNILLNAIIGQVMSDVFDDGTYDLSRQATIIALAGDRGLLAGPYKPVKVE